MIFVLGFLSFTLRRKGRRLRVDGLVHYLPANILDHGRLAWQTRPLLWPRSSAPNLPNLVCRRPSLRLQSSKPFFVSCTRRRTSTAHAYAHIHLYKNNWVCMYVCGCGWTGICVCVSYVCINLYRQIDKWMDEWICSIYRGRYIHIYACINIRTYIHPCIDPYIRAHRQIHTHTYRYAYIQTCKH